MNFIRVTDNDLAIGSTPVLLNLDSISWIRKELDGSYRVACAGSYIHIDQRDYQRILTALSIR